MPGPTGAANASDSLGALLLGIPEDGGLRYVGKVGTGFSARAASRPSRRPQAPGHGGEPFVNRACRAPMPARPTSCVPSWSEKSNSANGPRAGRLRHPTWRGLRPDKSPARGRGGVMAKSTRTTIDGRELSVSNLEKVLFPHSGFTKGQLIDFYVRVAPVMLPHLRERPLTMKRFPDGVEGKSFFEKHIPSHAPEWVPLGGRPGQRRAGRHPLRHGQ